MGALLLVGHREELLYLSHIVADHRQFLFREGWRCGRG